MWKKKYYKISIAGESEGTTVKCLYDKEYKLLKEIFEETESEYVGGEIYEVEPKYIVRISKKHEIIGYKCPNNIVEYLGKKYVGEQEKKYDFHNNENYQIFYYSFDSDKEAKQFSKEAAEKLDCKVFNINY